MIYWQCDWCGAEPLKAKQGEYGRENYMPGQRQREEEEEDDPDVEQVCSDCEAYQEAAIKTAEAVFWNEEEEQEDDE